MFAAMLLMLSLAGQVCPPGRPCPAPAVAPTLGYHAVQIQGRSYTVYGYLGADGFIHWDPARQPSTVTPAPPAPAPAARKPVSADATPNYGLGMEMFPREKGERIAASTGEAKRFIAEAKGQTFGADPDADGRVHLTVIGSESARKSVLNDLDSDPALSAYKGKIEVQSYAPDHWAVKGIYPPGSPAILIQKRGVGEKTGTVLFRAADYSGGPNRLAEELRKANPNYHPDSDPGAGGVMKCPLGFTAKHWPTIVVAVVALVLISHKKGPAPRA